MMLSSQNLKYTGIARDGLSMALLAAVVSMVMLTVAMNPQAALAGQADQASQAGQADEAQWRQYVQAGVEAMQARNMPEAQHQFELAAAEAERFGEDDVRTGTTIYQLAGVYATQGQLDRAEPLFLRALDILRAARGPTDPTVANVEFNLAQVYASRREYSRALALYEQVLPTYRSVFGEDSEAVARALRSSGLCLVRLENYDLAQGRLKKAMDLTIKRSGAASPQVAELAEELAKAYAAQGDTNQALQYMMRAVMLVEGQENPDPLQLARLYSTTGLVNMQAEKYDDALVLYELAEPLVERQAGKEHPVYARLLKAKAAAYQGKGDIAAAQSAYEQSLAIEEKALGADHLDLGGTLSQLADIHIEREEYEQALPYFERALAIARKQLGPDHELIAALATSYARTLKELGREDDADKLLEEANAMLRRLSAQRPATPNLPK